MTVREFLSKGIDIQCTVVYCYYDWNKDKRIICKYKDIADKEIRYMYCEENCIYIEVENED